MHSSRIKLSFTSKTGPFVRFFMYIPGSLVSELLHLNDAEMTAVRMWLNSVEIDRPLCESTLK